MSIPVMVLALAIILGLTLKIALLKARMQGIQEAQQRLDTPNPGGNNGFQGIVNFFAVVGLLTLLVLCMLLGTTLPLY